MILVLFTLIIFMLLTVAIAIILTPLIGVAGILIAILLDVFIYVKILKLLFKKR